MSTSNRRETSAEEGRPRSTAASSLLTMKNEPGEPVQRNDDPITGNEDHIGDLVTVTNNSSDYAAFTNLRHAATESAKALDAYKAMGLNLLDKLKGELLRIEGNRDAVNHANTIETLKKQAQGQKTILGVVGSTGQGKSSLINALLGEQRLIPTSCVPACTAVITEISYNNSDNPDRQYTAEIEFISKDEWRDELSLIFRDLATSQVEISNGHVSWDADVRVALAKVRAMYPGTSINDLIQTDIGSLCGESTVNQYLGTTKVIYQMNVDDFYRDVGHYIGSLQKEATHEIFEEGGDTSEKQGRMQLWPLIKMIRIFTKADVLSTGAVIVNLPGVEDSNPVRAAVAAKYIEKCDAIWVVAAINRAIKDKIAQKLLGQSFKNQLNYDGNYSRVTFVCSKTDDITINESAELLGPNRELDAFNEMETALENWETGGSQQLQNDENRGKSLSSYINELEKQVFQWKKLKTRIRKGQAVTASQIPSKKRKAPTRPSRASKRAKKDGSESGDDFSRYTSASEFWDALESDQPVFAEDESLSEKHIRSAIDHLRAKKKMAYEESGKLEGKIKSAIYMSEKLKKDYAKAKSTLLCTAIRKRGDYTREAMRRDFAEGLRELDQENSMYETLDNAETTIHDYSKIGRSLQVFCVSSKAYQGLCNWLGSSSSVVEGFDNLEDTGIPQLVAHAKKLSELVRSENNKSFLNGLLQVLHSVYMWCDANDSGLAFTEEEKQNVMGSVKNSLINLEKNLMKAVDIFVQKCKDILNKGLFAELEILIAKAATEAPHIAGEWPQLEEYDGGLPCTSYKAACRRGGVYSGRLGKRDFNDELARPLKKGLAKKWVNAFQQDIPEALGGFDRTSERLLENLHDTIEARIQKKASFASINTLRSQLEARAVGLTHITNSFSIDIVTLQRVANRKINQVIKEQMEKTYSICAAESGTGCFIRMQNRMTEHLEKNAGSLFKTSIDSVKEDLSNLCKRLESGLRSNISKLLDEMSQDYSNVIVGKEFDERVKKGCIEISKLLKDADANFDYNLRTAPATLVLASNQSPPSRFTSVISCTISSLCSGDSGEHVDLR